MTHDDASGLTRRTALKAAGLAAGGSLLGAAATPAAAGTDTSTIDDQLDLSATGRQEAIVVFDSRDSMSQLLDLSLPDGAYEYEVLPMSYTTLSTEQIQEVAGWDSVRRVRANEELEYFNDDSTAITGANTVQQELGYTGESVDVAVIDSGFSGPHPDFEGRIDSNWRWVDDPLGVKNPTWVDLGPEADTDNLGHGTHCMGIIGGDGEASDGQYKGMAPDTRLSMHMAGQTVYVSYAVAAWDHLLSRKDDPSVDFDVDVVSNSYGVARDIDYNPNDPVNVATWEAFQRDIVVCFAAGNDGPGADTLSRFAKAPHVIGVAASRDDKHVTSFSSRGRTPDEARETNYDRKVALRELGKYTAAMSSGERRLDNGEFVGTLTAGSENQFHAIETDSRADALELTLDLSPDVDGQQVTVVVHEGSTDGKEVAKFGEEVFYQHRSIAIDVDGGTTYWVELQPTTTAAVEYELEWEVDEQFRGEPSNYGPVGLYRPGLVTPGNSVMSTVGPTDSLDALEPDAEAYYTPMTGTSMACPGAAGIAALVVDAARQNGHGVTAMDVILTMEATAYDAHTAYTPHNAGAGFVDAAAAVQRAAAGDFGKFNDVSLVDPDTPTSLSVSGSRTDDGSTFTGGQTNQVEVTVSSLSHAATVRDTVPAEWSVITEHSDDVTRVEGAGDVQHIYFGDVAPTDAPVAVSYLVEAPNDPADTGDYTFGPATANSAKTDDRWVAFGGTDTNAVVGEDSNA